MDKTSFTLDELMNMEIEAEAPEHAYRRGYADGFLAASDTFYKLLYAGLDKKDAYFLCWDFRRDVLRKWLNGDCSHEILPPQLPNLFLEDK